MQNQGGVPHAVNNERQTMKTSKFSSFLLFSLWIVNGGAFGAETHPSVTWGAFVDLYYAYDFNRPSSFDRAYTTQPARHNEFNLNLAFLEGRLQRDKVRGRLAIQFGTSVQSNYSGEPTLGSVSGPTHSRNIQEAYIGYRIGEDTWVDAGIFLAHIGLESFISKDNYTYTRSLVADYSPYYQTGVRISTRFNNWLSGQFLILNGWQHISESNMAKSIGTQLNYIPTSEWTLTYNTYFGQESSFRSFHDVIVKYSPSELWTYALQADIGFQIEAPGGDHASWSGFALIVKRNLNPNTGVVVRVERYADPKQVLINSATSALPAGTSFRAWGASLGLDQGLAGNIWWRNELRGYWSDQKVFPSSNGFRPNDGVLVSSISAAF